MYQWGTVDHQALRTNGSVGRVEADMSAWIVDIIGSYQLGPLLLEARGVYTPGNKARDNLAEEHSLLPATQPGRGVLGGLGRDPGYRGRLLQRPAATNMGRHIGYDRYGRAGFGLRSTYSITPALSVYNIVSPTWTAEKVDTDSNSPLTPAPGLRGLR